jgi:hypothetical protein
MTSTNTSANAVPESSALPNLPTASGVRDTLPTRSSPAQQYLYFTEQDIQRILDNLDGLRDLVFPNQHVEDEDQLRLEQQFPSVCLIGLGRCGSNIALDVAELVYNARTFFLNEFNNEDRLKGESGYSPARWIRQNLRLVQNKGVKPVFLVEPLVMLATWTRTSPGASAFRARASAVSSCATTAR